MTPSPVDLSVLLQHLEYTAWASNLVLDACAQLPEDVSSRDLQASHGGLTSTLRHIYLADFAWFHRLAQKPFSRPQPFEPGLDELRQQWTALHTQLRDLVAAFSDAEIAETLPYTSFKGEAQAAPRWQMVLHLVNHATLHRGQVMSMLRQLGHVPPATDLIFFYRSQAAAS
ncbi:MAG: DinB family protein [Acidobacteriaceae bacterium]|nr:DinB family protein [Acidobacteriaceae bacterium]